MAFARTSRFLLLYGALVVPPLVGLLAILHAGGALTAPHAIGGHWTATLDGDDRCVAVDSAIEMTVSQSGTRAELTFSTAAYPSLSVDVRGDQISGTGGTSSHDSCGALAIEARIADRSHLEGTVRHPGCDDCRIVRFHAELAAARPRTGAKR